jgi:predicted HTH domain antitoxin
MIGKYVLVKSTVARKDEKLEIAIVLFQQKKLGLRKAREVAGIPLIEFQRELASRGIAVQDDVQAFEAEVENLRTWGDL